MSDLAVIDNETEVVTADAISGALVALSSGDVSSDVYSTFDTTDKAQGLTVWKALASSEPAKNNLKKKLTIVGAVILRVELLNEQSGEIQSQPRIVLVTDKGEAFHVTSPVVLRDYRTMVSLLGEPSAANPIDVQFVGGGSGTRQFVTLQPA